MVKYEISPSQRVKADKKTGTPFYKEGFLPCKILGFVRDSDSQSIKAIVHTCDFQDHELRTQSSVLLEHWKLTYGVKDEGAKTDKKTVYPFIDSVTLDCIHDRCFVVEENPGIHSKFDLINLGALENIYKDVVLVRNRKWWGREFIDGN